MSVFTHIHIYIYMKLLSSFVLFRKEAIKYKEKIIKRLNKKYIYFMLKFMQKNLKFKNNDS